MPRKYTPQEQINAFWNKVNKDGSIPAHCPELGQCWEWTAAFRKDNSYGAVLWGGINSCSHRISWILTDGEIPDGLWVLHKCDNPKCVRPSHLFLGTVQDNTDDRERKNRNRPVSGAKHYKAKLTDLQIIDIRREYADTDITQSKLAAKYGVSQQTIWNIVANKTRTNFKGSE